MGNNILINVPIAFWVLLIGLVITAIGAWFVKNKSTRKPMLIIGGIVAGAMVVYFVVTSMGVPGIAFLDKALMNQTKTVSLGQNNYTITYSTVPTGNPSPSAGACPFQPTATYSTKDLFSSTTVTGTAYYKVGNQPATTTATSNVNKDITYTYWVDNSSYYVKPQVKTANCDVNSFVADAWNNNSATITLYDSVGRATSVTGSGTYSSNISLGASGVANVELTYQGTAKKSRMPFGGVLVVEYNSSIASVTCSGSSIVPSPYHVTVSTSYTTNTYQVFGVNGNLDDGSGMPKTISCQFQNGATDAPDPTVYYFHFIPANYYLTNDGNIVLDVEKFLNQATTRTGSGTQTLTAFFS